jgi:hypothetical protein
MGTPPGKVCSMGRTVLGTHHMSGDGVQERQRLTGVAKIYRSSEYFKHGFPWIVPVCPMDLASHLSQHRSADCRSLLEHMSYSSVFVLYEGTNHSLKYLHPAYASICSFLHAVACIDAFDILEAGSEPTSVGFTKNYRGLKA